MAKIIVTGGAGFIGSHVCEHLLARGDSVACVDNLNDYYNQSIKEKNIETCRESKNFTFHEADIRDKENLEGIFEKEQPAKVVHLAARAGVRPSIEQPLLYEEVNVGGTLNLLEICKDSEIENFVFGSSSSVYGSSEQTPFREDGPTMPVSPYGVTKRSGEFFCQTYNHLYNIPISCLRFFTVYGPRGRPDMAIHKFTKSIKEGATVEMYGDGTSERDYTYISDIVSGVLSALDKKLGFEIINLGNSKSIRLQQLISVVEDAVGKKAEIKELPMQLGDVKRTCADISKAKKLLGYEPKVDIRQGIENFVNWYTTKR